MFQLRILLLAAAIMAWLVQPAYAGASTDLSADLSADLKASRDIVGLAADLVSTAALVETVDKTLGCQHRSLSKHRSENAKPDLNSPPASVSVNDVVAHINGDLPSLYLTASVNSVLDAIKPVIAELRTHADTDRQTRISCREARIRHMRDYTLLRDQWDRSVAVLKGWPGADVELIARLDAGLIGTSVGDKQLVFDEIDTLGTRTAGDFDRKLNNGAHASVPDTPAAQSVPSQPTPQKYF